MAASSPYTLKWGIMATGWIAECKSPNENDLTIL